MMIFVSIVLVLLVVLVVMVVSTYTSATRASTLLRGVGMTEGRTGRDLSVHMAAAYESYRTAASQHAHRDRVGPPEIPMGPVTVDGVAGTSAR